MSSLLLQCCRYGSLMMLTNWETLPQDRELYVVQSGIIKVSYQPDLGEAQEYFLGAGGVYNLYAALTGENLPGTTEAVAQASAGKITVIYICYLYVWYMFVRLHSLVVA